MVNISDDSKINQPRFPVVGIGASAGGLEALKKIINSLPEKMNMAIVIIQHLDPDYDSKTSDILTKLCNYPVRDVENDMMIEVNNIYVLSSNILLSIKNGLFKTFPRNRSKTQFMPIDKFFNSLAEEQREYAIGVILSGTVNDGSEGVTSIKLEGGAVLVQDPSTAKYRGMPDSAIKTGVIDFVLRPEEIATKLGLLGNYKSPTSIDGVEFDLLYKELIDFLKENQGIDFSKYKMASIKRRVIRRISLLGKKDLSSYIEFLKESSSESKNMVSDILIHVTSFFRGEDEFKQLKEKVFPELIAQKKDGDEFRIWVPGCSTGEEAYSLAMIFFEVNTNSKITLKIIATDISYYIIKKASAGIFSKQIEEQVNQERLGRFFEKTGDNYIIKEEVRRACLFSRHNCTSDTPFSRIDLVSCRNLLIYFSNRLQRDALSIFHYALRDTGLLFLGSSEVVSPAKELFEKADSAFKIYRKEIPRGNVKIPLPVFKRRVDYDNLSSSYPKQRSDLNRLSDKVRYIGQREFVPANFLINQNLEVLESNGDTSPFVELSRGVTSLKIYNLIKPCYVVDLRLALVEAERATTKAKIEKEGYVINEDGVYLKVNFQIFPLELDDQSEVFYSIYISQSSVVISEDVDNANLILTSEPREIIKDLQEKLSESIEYQGKLSYDFDKSHGELVTSNEELQSSNEELQSMNEEMETIKEELISTNEELKLLNLGLVEKTLEIVKDSEDMSNVFSCLDVSVVILDTDFNIRNYNSASEEILNLKSSDIGRSFYDLKTGFELPEFDKMLAKSLKEKVAIEVEIQNQDKTWYSLSLRPLFKESDLISGIALSMVDIDVLKTSALLFKRGHDDDLSIISKLPTPLMVLDKDMKVILVNDEFSKNFEIEKEFCRGMKAYDLCDFLWNYSQVEELVQKAHRSNRDRTDFVVDVTNSDGMDRQLKIVFQKFLLKGSGKEGSLVFIEDRTNQFLVERTLRISEEKYRKTLVGVQDGILLLNESGNIEFANQHFEKMFGYTAEELRNKNFKLLLFDDQVDEIVKQFQLIVDEPVYKVNNREGAICGRHKEGHKVYVHVYLSPFVSDNMNIITCNVKDMTELDRVEKEQQISIDRERILREEAEVALQVKNDFLASISHELLTPLSTILTWAQMLRIGKVSKEKEREVFASIENSAIIQKQLISDLLDSSRIRAGKFFLNLKKIDLLKTIENSIDILRPLSSSKEIKFELNYNCPTRDIWADPTRLNQIFCNILTNSIKFSEKKGKVYINVLEEDSLHGRIVIMEFRDEGKGIGKEYLSQIFERFTQEDREVTRRHGGLGLGLSIVQNLVCMHGGWVDVKSPGADKGTTFTVTLPQKNESCASFKDPMNLKRFDQLSRSQIPLFLDGVKILFFDLNNPKASYFKIMLRSLGASILDTVEQQGIKNEFESRIDLVVFCSEKLEIDNLSLSKIKQLINSFEFKKVPFAFMGRNLSDKEIDSLHNIGIDGVIRTPIDAISLSKVISALN